MTTPPEDPYARRPEDGANQHDQQQPGQQQPAPATPPPGQQYAATPQQYAQQQYSQPQYGPPQQYAQPSPPNPAQAKNWMGITSLVLSLSGLVFGFTAIAGIVFGHLGLSAAKRGEADNRGLSLAGTIVGYVLVALGILITIAFFGFFAWIATSCGADNPADWCTSDSSWEWEVEALA